VRALSEAREVASESLLARGVAFSIAGLVHLGVLAAFLAKAHVGLSVQLHPEAHPSDNVTPIIAFIVSQGAQGTKPTASSWPTLEKKQLASVSQEVDVPAAAPVWPAETDLTAQATQPAPSAGRTGLRCEVHIHQSLAGRVQAIDFGECIGDRIWQHTLLQTLERAAQLIQPTSDAQFPPVRTLTIDTDNLSPVVLAQQLSSTEMFEMQTISAMDPTVRPR